VASHALQDIEKPRLAREVARRLGQTIREGRFLPEQRLPSERRLSEELGVSRPVVREALSTLAAQGFVDIRPGSGAFVVDVAVRLAHVEPAAWFRDNWKLVEAFYDARLALEPGIAALASGRVTPERIRPLRAILRRTETVIARGEVTACIGLDIDFHRAIAALADNAFVDRMLSAIIDDESDLRRVLHRVPGRPLVAHGGHLRILAAIESGDPQRARDAMTGALEAALHDIERLVKGGDAPDPT
jgi:GntR family transcriptional repressor for pyruvate dehydrogenase complex